MRSTPAAAASDFSSAIFPSKELIYIINYTEKPHFVLAFTVGRGYHSSMRVKKDKAYVVLSTSKGYVQGAFPHTPQGKIDAEEYLKKLAARTGEEYKIVVH